MGRKVQGTQFPAGVWGSALSVHLKGENSMQYTAAMKQMPMYNIQRYTHNIHLIFNLTVKGRVRRWQL